MSIESVMPPNHLVLCHLLLLPLIFPSGRVFSNESALHIRWPKYWSFYFSISPCNEYSGLISFRIDWFDLLVVQGTPQSLLQHHSSKATILRHSAFYMAQLSHPFMTTGKTIALTIWTFVSKAMSLLFNTLSRLAIAFLARSKCLLIPRLQSPSAMFLEPKKIVWWVTRTMSQSHFSWIFCCVTCECSVPTWWLTKQCMWMTQKVQCSFYIIPVPFLALHMCSF